MDNQQSKSPLSSFLPLILLFVVVFFVMKQFQDPEEGKKPQQVTTPQNQPGATNPANRPGNSATINDFAFATARGAGKETVVNTKVFTALLNSKGGRVSAFYVRSHDELRLPEEVIASSKDPRAKEYKALEVTHHNGMDFQPHLWWQHPVTGDYWQIANPPLNDAAFELVGVEKSEKTGVQEVRFRLPLSFKGHRLELLKVYRFFPNEHFFRQITVLRNVERRPFDYNYAVYFKTFGDIGPVEETADTRMPATRFYYYGGDLFQRNTLGGESGCGSFGCGDKEPVTRGLPDALEFYGSTSRYFFAYSRFMGDAKTPLDKPDGVQLVSRPDPTGKESATVYFDKVQLAGSEGGQVNIGSPGLNLDATGAIAANGKGNAALLNQARFSRKDALIVDNQVFVGVRTDESHAFRDVALLAAEFGMEGPDREAREALFSSSYFKLFSKIKDLIVALMRWIYGFTGNYGWAIIIIAVAFKLVTWPLNQMQAKSMKKMTAIKPELDALNEKYADEPQEKQKQLMELYRKHKINPAKGCFPIMIQMPIFVALFSAFSEAIELWQSPFVLWMTDLSRPDTVLALNNLPVVGEFHLNILPLLMVGSQILYQQFTTMTADPQQKMLMYMMPLVFVFMFWSMPSGVTLYWTLQNVLGIVWQIAANRFSDTDTPALEPEVMPKKGKGRA